MTINVVQDVTGYDHFIIEYLLLRVCQRMSLYQNLMFRECSFTFKEYLVSKI
jgi:hypothetical protein